jgi:glutamine amidotransferase
MVVDGCEFMKCIIIDYGMGNLRSIQHKLEKIGADADISSKPEELATADTLILPGIGHFYEGMKNLKEYGLIPVLNKKVLEDKTPILGICLGMQLFTSWSEEGNTEGLCWIDAITKKFQFEDKGSIRVPHIGWNKIHFKRKNYLMEGVPPEQRFYFAHSYYVDCLNPDDVLTTTNYGVEFVSSLHRDNIFGTQFHPEKSHLEGMNIIKNFFSNLESTSHGCKSD